MLPCLLAFLLAYLQAAASAAELLMFDALRPFCFAGTAPLIFSPTRWNAHHFCFQTICFSLYRKPLKSLLQNHRHRGLGSPPRVLKQRPEAVPVALGGDVAAFLAHDGPKLLKFLPQDGSKLLKTLILLLVTPPGRSNWEPKFVEKVSWRHLFVFV